MIYLIIREYRCVNQVGSTTISLRTYSIAGKNKQDPRGFVIVSQEKILVYRFQGISRSKNQVTVSDTFGIFCFVDQHFGIQIQPGQ